MSSIVGTTRSTVAALTLGSGPQSLVLDISEDAWLGDAQFTVSVDGVQIGGIQTATASHAAGQDEAFTLLGSFLPGSQTISVTFLNDASAGTPATDRNLYVDSVTDGDTTDVTNAALYWNGTASFVIAPSILPVTVGTGPQSLVLEMSEDAWSGDAQFTVSVNGVQIGGIQTTTASHAARQDQAFTLLGNFGSGAQSINVTFLNDAYGGSASQDRNLYVDSIIDGNTTDTTDAAFFWNGTKSFVIKPLNIGVWLADDTGASSSDLITSDPTLSGTAAPNTVVTMTEGSTVLGTATANASGAWTGLPQGLANGTNTIVVTDRDAGGDVGTASLAFVLDNVAPKVTVALGAGTDISSANQVTNNPNLVGTGDANATVLIKEGTTLLGTTTADSSGNWSDTLTGLVNGATNITVSETDIAGNLGTASMSFLLNVPTASNFSMGINLSGLEYNPGTSPGTPYFDYVPPSTAELAYYHSEGINTIRLPFVWERMQPTLNGPLNQTYVSEIQTIVNYAGSLGMKVILDMHDYGGYGANKLGDGTLTDDEFADVWTKIAGVFNNNVGLGGYDLMNEPNAMPNASAWPNAAQAAVNAIRTIDTSSNIYVEGDDWASAGSWTQNNANLNIKDPSNKIIYEAHVYLDNDNSGTHFDWAGQAALGVTTETGVQRVEDFEGWLQQNGFKGDIGEIGAPGNNVNWLTSLGNTLAYAQSVGLPVQYWAGGPWWGSYPMSAEPTGLGTANVTNAPQMAVLTQYA